METAEGGTFYFTTTLLQASTGAFSVSNTTILIIIVLVLLLLTAITAGAETAFFTLTSKDIDYLKTREQISARQAIHLLDQPKMLLATILVSNNFINIAIVISTNLLVESFTKDMSDLLSILIKIVTITLLLILFGEVLPKVYASQNNMRMALFAAPVMKMMSAVFSPVSKMLVSSSTFIEEKIGNRGSNLSSVDFEQAIELSVGHTATREEVNIFKGILKFGNITVRQVMRTRLDVSGVPFDFNFPQVQKIALESGYSRMPVFEGNLDKIKGMIHAKDFLPHTESNDFDWHALIRPAYFVPEGKFIEDLLKEFQQKRIHFAIVVDEFGGTSGIVTLEDIMEEIIGDIKDEFDEEDILFKKIDDANYIFEGKTLINDVCKVIGENPETFENIRGESDSIAGLVLEIAGKFPALNETINFQNFDFTILELDKMRIRRVKLTINTSIEDF